jgi:cytochrome c oxidase subunit 5a
LRRPGPSSVPATGSPRTRSAPSVTFRYVGHDIGLSLASYAPPRTVRYASGHSSAESYEQFNARYVEFFNTLEDPFELMRGLNNCFIYDLVPSQEVIEAALRAARRVNDYGIAVRI